MNDRKNIQNVMDLGSSGLTASLCLLQFLAGLIPLHLMFLLIEDHLKDALVYGRMGAEWRESKTIGKRKAVNKSEKDERK